MYTGGKEVVCVCVCFSFTCQARCRASHEELFFFHWRISFSSPFQQTKSQNLFWKKINSDSLHSSLDNYFDCRRFFKKIPPGHRPRKNKKSCDCLPGATYHRAHHRDLWPALEKTLIDLREIEEKRQSRHELTHPAHQHLLIRKIVGSCRREEKKYNKMVLTDVTVDASAHTNTLVHQHRCNQTVQVREREKNWKIKQDFIDN